MNRPKRTINIYLCTLLLIAGIFPIGAMRARAAPVNLIANPSVESTGSSGQPEGWLQGAWGNNTADFASDTSGLSGEKALSITLSNYSDGDAKWYFDPQPVVAGSQYAYSDSYKSTAPSKVVVQFEDTNGHNNYVNLGTIDASPMWKKINYTFWAPLTAKNMTVFHVISGNGTLQTDDFSLINKGTLKNGTVGDNLVSSASFETPDPNQKNMPLYWQKARWGKNTTSFDYLSDDWLSTWFGRRAHTGSHAIEIKMKDYSSGDAKWYFDQAVVTPGTMYRFSDYYKSTRGTEVAVAFTTDDGTNTYQTIGLPNASGNWTQFETAFAVPQGAAKMTIYHLIRGEGTLTLDDYSLRPYKPEGFKRAMVSLTFDDGHETQLSNTVPLLQKYDFTSTQYIATGLIGKRGYLTLDQLKELATTQEIGAHSITHPDLSSLSQTQYTNELAKSQSQLKQWTGKPVSTFAYPEGAYTDNVVNTAMKYYGATRSIEGGLNSKDMLNAYDIKVENVMSNTTAAQVAEWIAVAQATNSWLVLVYHSINPDTAKAGPFSTTPTLLDSQLAVIKDSGITVLPMSQALAEAKSQY